MTFSPAFEHFHRSKVVPPSSVATVAVAYVHGENMRPAFTRSLVGTIIGDRGRNLHGFITSEGLYVPRGRNEVVTKFLSESGCDWLWFLDTDVAFDPEVFYRLLDATDEGEKKIVAAPYWSIGDDGEPYCTWMGETDGALLPYFEIPDRGAIELGACGMGFTLIHRDVFTDIAKNRGLDDPWIWFGHDLVRFDLGPARLGEDVTFCIRALQAGHRTWGVCGLEVDHLKIQATPKGKVVAYEAPSA